MEGAPHTAKISYIKCVLRCPPAPVYKGAREEEAGPRRGRTKCGVLGVLVGFHLPYGIGKEEGKKRRKEGGAPLP